MERGDVGRAVPRERLAREAEEPALQQDVGEVERGGVGPGAPKPPGEHGRAHGVRGREEGEDELEDAVWEVAEPVGAAANCNRAVSGHRDSPLGGKESEGWVADRRKGGTVGFLHPGDDCRGAGAAGAWGGEGRGRADEEAVWAGKDV